MYLKLILGFSMVVCFGQQPALKAISWNDIESLRWLNFEKLPDQNNPAAALTASGISFRFSVNKTGAKVTAFTAIVSSLFYPEKSWYKKEFANAHILKHEQFHFNITELFARKFREKISKLKASQNINEALNSIYEAITNASLEMQRKYDLETKHSIDKEKQLEWETYITAELKKLDFFKTC
jgi:hypothetical protein